MKEQITLGSPRNIVVNTLNGNTFFTLDYEGNQTMYKTFYVGHDHQAKAKKFHQTTNNKFLIKNPVRSAQISRSLQVKTYLPYTRIRKVDEIVRRNKKLEEQVLNIPKERQKISFKLPSTQKPSSKQYRSFLIDTVNIDSQLAEKKLKNPLNNFQENYKNRKKLADRVSKKSPRVCSPLHLKLSEQKDHEMESLDPKFFISQLQDKTIEINKMKLQKAQRIKKRYN